MLVFGLLLNLTFGSVNTWAGTLEERQPTLEQAKRSTYTLVLKSTGNPWQGTGLLIEYAPNQFGFLTTQHVVLPSSSPSMALEWKTSPAGKWNELKTKPYTPFPKTLGRPNEESKAILISVTPTEKEKENSYPWYKEASGEQISPNEVLKGFGFPEGNANGKELYTFQIKALYPTLDSHTRFKAITGEVLNPLPRWSICGSSGGCVFKEVRTPNGSTRAQLVGVIDTETTEKGVQAIEFVPFILKE